MLQRPASPQLPSGRASPKSHSPVQRRLLPALCTMNWLPTLSWHSYIEIKQLYYAGSRWSNKHSIAWGPCLSPLEVSERAGGAISPHGAADWYSVHHLASEMDRLFVKVYYRYTCYWIFVIFKRRLSFSAAVKLFIFLDPYIHPSHRPHQTVETPMGRSCSQTSRQQVDHQSNILGSTEMVKTTRKTENKMERWPQSAPGNHLDKIGPRQTSVEAIQGGVPP